MARVILKDAAGVEREFEIGMDEAFKVLNASVWPANVKRTYDEYQDLGLKAARSQGKIADRIGQDSENHSEEIRKTSVQALQNAVENANLAAKGYLERINLTNTHVAANVDLSSDTMLTILATKLAEKLKVDE